MFLKRFFELYFVIFLSLFFSPHAHANLCKNLFPEGSTASTLYTPSKWHLMGDDIANRVVQSLSHYKGSSANSVWLDFTRDPRYNGRRPTKPSGALNTAMNTLEKKSSKVDKEALLLIKETVDDAKSSWPYFFVTWENLGIRGINRLIAHRIYPVGLTNKSMNVDGRTLEPKAFFEHDLGHAFGNEAIINSSMGTEWGVKDNFSKKFYENFQYDSIIDKLSDSDKVLFDIAYFLYFHEGIGTSGWGYMMAQVHASSHLSIESIQQAYKATMGARFDFDFHAEGGLAIFLQRKNEFTTNNLIQRFLNKGDLYVNLPVEIKNQLKETPEKSSEILANFLSKAFTVFFSPHYDLSKRLLGFN